MKSNAKAANVDKNKKSYGYINPKVIAIDPLTNKEVEVSQMRKVIARRLGESKFTAPHY